MGVPQADPLTLLPPSALAERLASDQEGFASAAAQRERGSYDSICWQPEPRSGRDEPTCIGVWEPHDRSAATQLFQ